MKKRFRLWRVSATAHEVVSDLEIAVGVLATTDKEDREAVEQAFDRVNARRKEIYDYIEELESRCGVTRTVNLRF